MRIGLVTPTPPDSAHGNGVTARRWAAMLRELGHAVLLTQSFDPSESFDPSDEGDGSDVLVALHAHKSAPSVTAFRAAHPNAPVIIALTGTDLYPNLTDAGVDLDLLASAARLVVLQPLGLDQLPASLRPRARVIVQSVPPIPAGPRRSDCFEVAFLAHLRPVKDPLRLAEAVRLLPATSRIQATHVGESRDAELAEAARLESAENPRYTWLGPRRKAEALDILARSRVLALTSWHEGGANVVSEALAADVPVISSHIPGSVGLLGEDYPGYFLPGDAAALARLLNDLEHDRGGRYTELRDRCRALRGLVDPARERQAWADLLAELALPAPSRSGDTP